MMTIGVVASNRTWLGVSFGLSAFWGSDIMIPLVNGPSDSSQLDLGRPTTALVLAVPLDDPSVGTEFAVH